jgi:ATP-dependent metalloprotease FtsH
MDSNGGRRLPKPWGRHKHTESYKRTVSKFLNTHRQALFTTALLTALAFLLFGIASRLQAPTMNTSPNGVTAVSYSTFMVQAQAGNVIAVITQSNDINALLAKPLSQNTQSVSAPVVASTPPPNNNATDIATWSRYVGGGYTNWSSTASSPSIDPARAIYTHIPGSGDAKLMQMLISHHVIVNTLPLAQTPGWLASLGRFVPILLFVLVALVLLAPKNKSRASNSLDERANQFGKIRVRRFERAKENNPSRVEKSPSGKLPLGTPSADSKTRVSLEPPVTFADVAGIDEVRTEVEEIVQFLRSPQRFSRLGARIPRGALLVGPPGTGKTLLAKAVAGEAGVPFFSISASEFVEMFVGVGASRVRDLFNQARQSAPCVVFIDEIDAVGRKRSMRISGSDERDQTLNQLLVELDGFDNRKAVVVLAATNRVDILDKALLRPGRFDRHITVSCPDRAGREAILRVHTRRTPLSEEVSLERLARLTTGMSGADLANLVNEAALIAARKNLESITHDCFEDALSRVQLGALRPLIMGEKDRRIIAYHEGGHALVAHYLPQADRVNRVTILPRGQSLGVTQFTAEEDRYNFSRETLMARIAVGLGGRAAEELTFGSDHVTTGAENDLQVVTDLARKMVTRWGMSQQVGVVFADYEPGGMSLNMRRLDPDELPMQARSFVVDADGRFMFNGSEPRQQPLFAMSVTPGRSTNSSTSMTVLIDSEVQRILNEGYDMARSLLREHNAQLVKLADTLMEREQLGRQEFEALFEE